MFIRHLIVHLRHVVEEGKVLVLHLDEVGDDLVEARLLADDLPDPLKRALVLGRIHVHLDQLFNHVTSLSWDWVD